MTPRRLAALALVLAFLDGGADTPAARTHRPRVGGNLVPDAAVRSTERWTLLGDAAFDRGRSRGRDGSGSFRLVTPYSPGLAGSSRVVSDYIPVDAAGKHTLGFYLKAASGPTYVWSQVSIYDRDRDFLRNLKSSGCGTATDDRWEECALSVAVPKDAAFVRLRAIKGDSPRAHNRAWIDDFYFGAGLGLEQPPSAKTPFAGADVRVDALGNFEIRREGRWTPFFPLGIYADGARDWRVYSRQGWNVVMRTDSADAVERARDAVSELNPHGLMAGFSISPYVKPASPAYHDLRALRSHLREVFRRGLGPQLLLHHWDNEIYHEQWRVPADVIRAVRRLDADPAGRPRRPIYALQGTYGLARTHAARGLVDVAGTYVGGSAEPRGPEDGDTDGFFFLDGLERQTSPASFAQFNGVRGPGDLRLRLYNSILLGARAAGYWRDCLGPDCAAMAQQVGPVDATPWWPDVVHLRRELDLLLPLLREPHWTSWRAVARPAGAVRVGTRDHDGDAYLILVNQTARAQTVTLSFDGLPYAVAGLVDPFSSEPLGAARGGAVTLTLPALAVAHGTRVARLVRGAEGVLDSPSAPAERAGAGTASNMSRVAVQPETPGRPER